jgi:Tfp pilus assembly major pilin PilA
MDLIVIAGVVVVLAAIAIPNLNEARNRSKQKQTMAAMRDAATRHEAGKPFGALRDGWGHPMHVRVHGKHYSIRAAGRDGRFESNIVPHIHMTRTFDEDLLFIDGNFRHMPEGI